MGAAEEEDSAVLKEEIQEWRVKFQESELKLSLVRDGMPVEMFLDDSRMSCIHRAKLTKNRVDLCRQVSSEDIIDSLVQSGAILREEGEEAKAKNSRRDGMAYLLDVLDHGDSEAYPALRRALQPNHSPLVEKLDVTVVTSDDMKNMTDVQIRAISHKVADLQQLQKRVCGLENKASQQTQRTPYCHDDQGQPIGCIDELRKLTQKQKEELTDLAMRLGDEINKSTTCKQYVEMWLQKLLELLEDHEDEMSNLQTQMIDIKREMPSTAAEASIPQAAGVCQQADRPTSCIRPNHGLEGQKGLEDYVKGGCSLAEWAKLRTHFQQEQADSE